MRMWSTTGSSAAQRSFPCQIVCVRTCSRYQRVAGFELPPLGQCEAVVCRPSTRPALVAPLLALALLLAAPALARADCASQPLARTFLPWLDAAWYEAAPDGSLEGGGAGWSLAGGAAVVAANDPYEPGSSAL